MPRHTCSVTLRSTQAPLWCADHLVPDWLELRDGRAPIIIVAPHGGRRQRPVKRGDSVNDLWTAEIAGELAQRLDAHALINHGLDRNDIDLNRISHLAGRAPEVLRLLRAAIDHVRTTGSAPLVLFVHGWNMVVPCCDVGVGLRRRGDRTTGRFPTMSQPVFDGVVGDIERALSARGISTGVGRRYSASGRDNAAQLFSGRHHEHESDDVAYLAGLSLAGSVHAAQLELGIPLRWEGRLRDALLDGLVEGLAGYAAAEPAWRGDSEKLRGWAGPHDDDAETAGVEAEPGYSLQAVLDADGTTGLFCGVEPTSAVTMAGRFCVVCTDGSMMLLVGEGSWSGQHGCYELEGFSWDGASDGQRIHLCVSGPMIRYRSHDAYLDLEMGLADSELVDAHVELEFAATSNGCGRLHGTVRAGGIDLSVDTTAFLDRGGRRAGGNSTEGRVRVLVAMPDSDAVRAECAHGDEAWMRIEQSASDAPLGRIAMSPGESPDEDAGALSQAIITARVPVWRPGPAGTVTRWTFGMIRCGTCTDEAASLPGLFDTLEVFHVGGVRS